MIYDLPKIEAKQIENAHKNRIYKVERDRLKSRFFIYVDYPKITYHGLNLSEARKYVLADFTARYERLIGRNVLFSIGYNNIDSMIYHNSSKLDKPLYNFCLSQYSIYQKELRLLDISFDEEKEILFSSDEYVKYVQQVFLFLYEKNLITLKHGLVVYDERRIYQKGEYYEEYGKYFTLNGKKLKHTYKNYYSLKLSSIKKDLTKEIEKLDITDSAKTCLLERLCYRKLISIKCCTTVDEMLEIKTENPEFLCGVSYIALNPDYIDIKPFLSADECTDYEDFKQNISKDFIYTGASLINPIINNQIPIFVSRLFDEKIHIGIPSLSDSEEIIVNQYELDFNPVFDYINDECVLVNSGHFNGLSMLEAHDVITDYLINEMNAEVINDMKLDEFIISSNIRFGIPVPLHVDQTPASIPVVHNLKHDVKLESGELADKNVVKEFLTDDFVSHLLPNAIKLKGEMGIMDFEELNALNEIGLFPNADIAYLDKETYINDLLYNIIFNRLLYRYYSSDFDCEFKKIKVIKPVLDTNSNEMNRENNNLVSISSMIKEYGSSLLRLYYAACGNLEDNLIYNESDINDINEILNSIVKVYYYPIDESCVDLEMSYQRMVDSCNMFARDRNFNMYFKMIEQFVKKVHEVKHISRAQAKGLLIILSVILPSLSEQIKEDVLNLREPLYYFSWPE